MLDFGTRHRDICGVVLFKKLIGVLITGAAAFEENAECMFTAFDRIVDFFLARKSSELYVGGCTVPEEISGAIRKKAVKFARFLVG